MARFAASLPAVARILLGGIFFVFGLNGFLSFLPQPPPPPEATAFIGGLASTGYFFPLLKGTEALVGLALLAGRWVPLALTVAAPIIVNIVAFHLFVVPGGIVLALVMLAVEIALAWWYRDAFRGVLAARAVPRSGATAPERATSSSTVTSNA